MSVAPWLRNFLGQRLSIDELADIKHPIAEVQCHATLKFAETGLVIGVGIGQLMGMIRTRKFRAPQKTAAFLSGRKGRNWMIGCSVLSLPACQAYYRAMKYDMDDLYERAFRLRSNKNQLRIDRGTIFSGLMVGGILFHKGLFWYGVPLGMMLGLTSMSFYNAIMYKIELNSTNKQKSMKAQNLDDLPLIASQRIKKSQDKTKKVNDHFENVLTDILESKKAMSKLKREIQQIIDKENGEDHTTEVDSFYDQQDENEKEQFLTKMVRKQRDNLATRRKQNEQLNTSSNRMLEKR